MRSFRLLLTLIGFLLAFAASDVAHAAQARPLSVQAARVGQRVEQAFSLTPRAHRQARAGQRARLAPLPPLQEQRRRGRSSEGNFVAQVLGALSLGFLITSTAFLAIGTPVLVGGLLASSEGATSAGAVLVATGAIFQITTIVLLANRSALDRRFAQNFPGLAERGSDRTGMGLSLSF